MKEQDMSISADPIFVAAESAWRRESLAAGFPTGTERQHHGASVRAAIAAVAHRHGRHARPGHHGTPRVA
jgi:hypothetical protein